MRSACARACGGGGGGGGRHYAEHSGYWETTNFLKQVRPPSLNPASAFACASHRLTTRCHCCACALPTAHLGGQERCHHLLRLHLGQAAVQGTDWPQLRRLRARVARPRLAGALTSNIPPDRPPGLQHTALMTPTTTTALRCVHACMPRPAVPMRAPPRPARWLPRGRG
jgi:hypothetical protein